MDTKNRIEIDKLPLLIAAVSAIAITLSISRQIGFFGVAAPKLFSLLSLQDLLQNSLFYIPSALLSVFAPMVGGVIGASIGTYFGPSEHKQSRLTRALEWVASARFTRSDLITEPVLVVLIYLFVDQWPLLFQFVIVFNLMKFFNLARDHFGTVPIKPS